MEISGLWTSKFKIRPDDRVATYGSCFAQHIGRALRDRGYRWLIAETAPKGMLHDTASVYNDGVFSARTSNIYTASLLRQWLDWVEVPSAIPDEIWPKDGRFYDPFRPAIEPGGFADAHELRRLRQVTIDAFAESVRRCSFFVFTLGLTESWWHRDGHEYPMCPGTIVGDFDPACHIFENQDYARIQRELGRALTALRRLNPRIRIILTVSPVPLTATASGQHVLTATMHSKSILRAIAAHFATRQSNVDYFPSYEIINSPAFQGYFFEPNRRNVAARGVAFVMDSFFADLYRTFPEVRPRPGSTAPRDAAAVARAAEREVCEEEILAGFAGDRA